FGEAKFSGFREVEGRLDGKRSPVESRAVRTWGDAITVKEQYLVLLSFGGYVNSAQLLRFGVILLASREKTRRQVRAGSDRPAYAKTISRAGDNLLARPAFALQPQDGTGLRSSEQTLWNREAHRPRRGGGFNRSWSEGFERQILGYIGAVNPLNFILFGRLNRLSRFDPLRLSSLLRPARRLAPVNLFGRFQRLGVGAQRSNRDPLPAPGRAQDSFEHGAKFGKGRDSRRWVMMKGILQDLH